MSVQDLHVYKAADDKTKIGILRSELRKHILTIQGFSSILKTRLSEGDKADEDLTLVRHVEKVIEAADNMEEIIEILTS